MLRRKKFIIGGLIVLAAIAYLSYTSLMYSATYYYTVGEFLEPQNLTYEENVQVKGQVAPGSVEQEGGGLILRFTIVDAQVGQRLPVVYRGVVPDSFKVGSEAIVEGYIDSAGVFHAHTLMPQCASKYVPE